MEYGTDKGKEKGEYNADEMPTIRIILKSQETKNLEYVANTIVKLAKEKQLPTTGNSTTTLLSKFTPIDPDNAVMMPGSTAQYFRANTNTRAVYRPNSFTQKQMN